MSKSHVSRVRELYKLILRIHRSLPDDLKILGDNYAREEFKRHKKCKPQEAHTFLNEWREYAVSMSRQVAPARAQRRPSADGQPAGPSRRVIAAEQGQAAGGREVIAAEQGQVAGGREVRAAEQEQAAGGGEVRAAEQGQAGFLNVLDAAGVHLRFGNDLGEELMDHFTPEQILSLFRLLVTSQGGVDPQAEYANEPIDIGIELIEADVYSKLTDYAKKQVLEMESEEIRKFIRGEIEEHNIVFNKNFWFEMFSDAQIIKDIEEFGFASHGARIADDEAKKARLAAGIAEMKSMKAKKIAEQAIAALEDFRKIAEGTEAPQGNTLHKTVIKLEKNALKKANKAKAINEKVVKLQIVAKSKEVEAKAAVDFSVALGEDVKDDLKKFRE